MRRLIRAACPPGLQRVLDARQAKVDHGAQVKAEWTSFSRLKAYRELREVLESALGHRRRCAYCSDSMGADVEHFWPKEMYPAKAFIYENLFLICSTCNRKKSQRFPVEDGIPQIVDPFFDDPWDSLYLTTTTGWITARLVQNDDGMVSSSAKGEATLAILGDVLNCEPVREGRRRAWPVMVACLEEHLRSGAVVTSLEAIFGEVDDYGLVDWLIHREGKELAPVVAMRAEHPDVWRIVRDLPRSDVALQP